MTTLVFAKVTLFPAPGLITSSQKLEVTEPPMVVLLPVIIIWFVPPQLQFWLKLPLLIQFPVTVRLLLWRLNVPVMVMF